MQHHIENRQELAKAPFQCANDSAITPFPWTVESHPDTEGAYIIHQARHEQQVWCDQGYDISEEEGHRRCLIVARHNVGNIRLLQAAPELFASLRSMIASPREAKALAIRALESVSPYWWDMKITCHHTE